MNKLRAHLLAAANEGMPNYVVAGLVGIPPARLSRLARGETQMNTTELRQLADFFGVDTNEILGTYVFEFPDPALV
jgi:transcriptional regulator with XRE-family HTH domain